MGKNVCLDKREMWAATVQKPFAEKMLELKRKLLIKSTSTVIIKAVGELYERECGKKWME